MKTNNYQYNISKYRLQLEAEPYFGLKLMINVILTLLLSKRMQDKNYKNKYFRYIQPLTVLQVQEEHLVEETDKYKYDLHIPVILGIENEQVDMQIHEDIKKDVNRFIDELKTVANEYIILNTPYTLKATYEIYSNDQFIVSCCIVFSNYYGGAHGMEYKICYNYNILTGKRLKLSDLFKNESYKETINKIIETEIKRRNDEFGYEVINAFKGIGDDPKFYIKDGQLVIYFDLYEIAPYVAGIIEFTMPKEVYYKPV